MIENTMFESQRRVEAILFAAKEPVERVRLHNAVCDGIQLDDVITKLNAFYENSYIQIINDRDMYTFSVDTSFIQDGKEPEIQKSKKIEGSSLIALSVIAFHQPVTFKEINDLLPEPVTKKVIERLINLDLIERSARKGSTGRAITYTTTDEFLNAFQLESIDELPTPTEVEDTFKEVRSPEPTVLNRK